MTEETGSNACPGNLNSLHSGTVDVNDTFAVDICSKENNTFEASVWEVSFSSSEDFGKVLGTFESSGRQRLRQTQETPVFDTQLSIMTIVGLRGSGKSTILSMLSGKNSMFEVGNILWYKIYSK